MNGVTIVVDLADLLATLNDRIDTYDAERRAEVGATVTGGHWDGKYYATRAIAYDVAVLLTKYRRLIDTP
jgi:hypothetical protein